jgi:hypothetical protein
MWVLSTLNSSRWSLSKLMRSQVPCWTHLRVQLCRVAESWDLGHAPDFQHLRGGWEGRARSPGIRLGRDQACSLLKFASQTNTSWLESIRHPFGVGTSHEQPRTHLTHHGPGSRVCHHLTPYSKLYDSRRHPHPNVTFSRDSQVGVPKLSRMCPDWTPGTLRGHISSPWPLIATMSKPKL